MEKPNWTDKPASAWQLQDIEDLAQAEEGLYLEFKKPAEFIENKQFSRDKFVKELSETVSAFLNAEGGVLLIGIQTDKSTTDRKVEYLKPPVKWKVDETWESFGITLTASRIRDLVYGNLSPKPFGIEVQRIDTSVGSDTTNVFVVTVPASTLGAHQSLKTLRYYKRTADGDVPMLDYERRDVDNRRAGPLLVLRVHVSGLGSGGVIDLSDDGYASVIQSDQQPGPSGQPGFPASLILTSKNLGRGTATVARFDLGMPNCWTVSPRPPAVGAPEWESDNTLAQFVGKSVTVFIRRSVPRVVPRRLRHDGLCEQGIEWWTGVHHGEHSTNHPLWPSPDIEVNIATINIALPNPAQTEEIFWVPWRTMTEGMPENRGAVFVKQDPSKIDMRNFDIGDVDWAGANEDERFETLKRTFDIT